MLQLKNITKRYEAGEFSVDALKGVSLDFRKSDFVSVLGPSGCGKTTLLNIIGGLDKYTDGDLVINGKSTKNFTDRDWDAYRNHSIGFVFQSYNLIPHQSVLQNVELALALSGVKKAERTLRAKAALDQVGLQGMYHKRPGEMSGGQMQRVAIARAIVNNPDIILADEPTGALDTETSLQVMEILKEISKDRLVVMVTHNPDLAERYSTRIVKMLDGLLVDDSAPLSEQEIAAEQAADEQKAAEELAEEKTAKKRKKKPSMSFGTSFMLSLKNLFTKRGRTILTSFAGSIGIIGIALIFAVSQGTSNYISAVQEDTLASYPLTIEQTHTDMSSMFSAFVSSATSVEEHEKDAVYEKMALYNLTKSIRLIQQSENDLAAYKRYLENQLADPASVASKSLNGVHYSYDLDLLVYTQNVDGSVMKSDTSDLMRDMIGALYGVDLSSVSMTGGGLMSMLMSTSNSMASMWQELLPAKDGGVVNNLLKDQYDLVYGSWPSDSDNLPLEQQVVLVVDGRNEIDDMTLYALGLKSKEEIDAIVEAARKEQVPPESSQKRWTYEEICAQRYKVIFNYECYRQLGDYWYDVREQGNGLVDLYNDPNVGLNLKIVGIVAPNPDASSHMLSGSICYTQNLTKYVIGHAQNAEIVAAQKANPNVDVFTGKYFKTNKFSQEQKAQIFRDYVEALPEADKSAKYIAIHSVPSDAEVANTAAKLSEMDEDTLRATILQMTSMGGSSSSSMTAYVSQMSFEQLQGWIPTIAPLKAQSDKAMLIYAMAMQEANQKEISIAEVFSAKLEQDKNSTDEVCKQYFDRVIEFSDTNYDDNLVKLGCLDVEKPSSISLYAISFEAKENLENDIAAYNETVPEEQQLKYTDYVGLIMSSVTTILDAITYVLISFVSISLVVSSIMIGVITLISVQERTKEIGILRAIGASKRNVSGMFNAETVIIGFTSGVFGVGITYVLCLVVNLILHAATGIMSLNASLPIWVAAILVGISMLLTLIAGIIPSRSAAKKDPVVALRTE